jgi:hypothetical protein
MAVLKKTDLIPGLKIQVRTDRPLNNGLRSVLNMFPGPVNPNDEDVRKRWAEQAIPYLHLYHFHPSFGVQSIALLHPGDVVETVRGPHSKALSPGGDRVNVVELKTSDGRQGYVFWCEVKANCLKV